MSRERLYLFDTTLRDGALTTASTSRSTTSAMSPRCSTGSASTMSRAAIRAPTRSTRISSKKPTKRASFCAFGMTKRPGRSAATIRDLRASRRRCRCDRLRREILGLSRACRARLHARGESRCISDSVKAAVASGREAMVDCEHFFDGYKANPKYALPAAGRDRGRGALGGALRHQWRHAARRSRADRRRSRARHSGERLGIHAHNDTGNAVANSLAAIRAGARQVRAC